LQATDIIVFRVTNKFVKKQMATRNLPAFDTTMFEADDGICDINVIGPRACGKTWLAQCIRDTWTRGDVVPRIHELQHIVLISNKSRRGYIVLVKGSRLPAASSILPAAVARKHLQSLKHFEAIVYDRKNDSFSMFVLPDIKARL
jgi:hypothetical protein